MQPGPDVTNKQGIIFYFVTINPSFLLFSLTVYEDTWTGYPAIMVYCEVTW
jgi:hypothetical protein